MSLFVALIFVFNACNKDDYTGHSTLSPTNPTISVDFGTIGSIPDAGDYTGETDSTLTVNLSMDVAQIVDVAVFVTVVSGTATVDEDFSLSTDMVMIRAGETTASFDVTILKDEIFEATETFTIQVGDDRTANATIVPVTSQYTIPNATEDDLVINFSWGIAEGLHDVDGEPIGPTDLADMRLLVMDMAFNIVAGADGGSFETAVLPTSMADGDYYVATDFYAAMDLGSQGDADIDFFLDFSMVGQAWTANFEYLAALNNSANIDNTMYFVIITKLGNTWTVNQFAGFNASDIDFASSVWNDGAGDGFMPDDMYPNEVVVAGTTGAYTIVGLNFGWMVNYWGETVTTSTPVDITFADDGTLEILEQAYITTDYLGSPYDYTIYGTGNWNRFLSPVAMTIDYEMSQDGWLVGDYLGGLFYADIVWSSDAKKKSITMPEKPTSIIKPY